MALDHLIDTDVIIWHLRGHEPTTRLLGEGLTPKPLGCSSVTLFEVWTGVRPQEETDTRTLLESFHTIEVSAPVAYQAADYWRQFRQRGITLGKVDALIAATAKVHGLRLVTYNPDHFPMQDIALHEPMPQV